MRSLISFAVYAVLGLLVLAPVPSVAQSDPASAAAAPAAPAAPPARVRFRAALDGDVYTVRVDGKAEQACQTPCELTLPLGAHDVQVTGSNRFAQRIDLTGPTALQVERRRTGRMVLGIVSLAVGVPVALVGLELIVVANADANENPPSLTDSERSSLKRTGAILAVAGGAFAAVGGIVGFSTMGRTRLAPDGSQVSDGHSDTGLRLAGVGVAPTPHGGGVVGVAFTF